MCRRAFAWIPNVYISPVERDLEGESLTLRTLEHLASLHPEWSMRLLIGADVVNDVPKWHRFDRISQIAPPIIMGRAGVTAEGVPEALLPQVSSTEVRDALARGDMERLEKLVPRSVLSFIHERGLYRRS